MACIRHWAIGGKYIYVCFMPLVIIVKKNVTNKVKL